MHEFANPAAEAIIAELSGLFKTARIYETDKPILFVCGGKIEDGTKLRPQLLEWVSGKYPDAIILLAEYAFRDTIFHDPPKFVNIATFEKLISDVADCVVLFPESVGSFAELGLFSHITDVRSKTLIINDFNEYASDSFLANGPIRTIDKYSYLSPSIPIHPTAPDFTHVAERLGKVILRKKEKTRRFEYKEFKKLRALQRMQVALEIIHIFQVVSLDGMHHCIKLIFGSASYDILRQMISILVGMGYVRRVENHFCYARKKDSLLRIDDSTLERLKARALYYYMKH